MKRVKIALLFFAVLVMFGSCATAQQRQMRAMHTKEIHEYLDRYSDILDIARSEVNVSGRIYGAFQGPPSGINLRLYLRHDHENRETVTRIRDGLIDFFHENDREARGETGFFLFNVYVEINYDTEGGRERVFYTLRGRDGNWFEGWGYDTTFLQVAR